MCSNRCANPVRFLRLDAEPDPVHDLDDHHRRRVVLADHHAQAVRQLAVDDRHREVGGRAAGLRNQRRACEDREAHGEQSVSHTSRIYHTGIGGKNAVKGFRRQTGR